MSTALTTRLSPEEYLAIERAADRKSDYWNGEMFVLAGASERHGSIVANLVFGSSSRSSRLRPRTTTVGGSSPTTGRFRRWSSISSSPRTGRTSNGSFVSQGIARALALAGSSRRRAAWRV